VGGGSSGDFVLHFRVSGMISFGNFVFLGLRSNSGIGHQSDVDLYLRGEDGLRLLTDYRCNLVFRNSTLCLVNSFLVSVPVWQVAPGGEGGSSAAFAW
jgi:hypothetical protein